MRLGCGMAILAILSLTAGTPASAAVCLDKSMTIEEIVAAIDATPGCERAMALFEDCQLGSSGDIDLGAAVEKKCEADFVSALKPAQKRIYANQLGRCDAKFADKQGTMWRSATAMCRAEVSQRYARKTQKKTQK